jgi:hypothetical protein
MPEDSPVGPGITECEHCGDPFLYWLVGDALEPDKEKNDKECRPAMAGNPPKCKREGTP